MTSSNRGYDIHALGNSQNSTPFATRILPLTFGGKDLAYELSFTLKVLAVLAFLSSMFPLPHGVSKSAGGRASFLRVAHGPFNEKILALWIGVEGGFFHKHGLDVEVADIRMAH